MKLRLGARGSALSLAQAKLVMESLAGRAEIELVKVQTTGDRLSAAGSPIEWKGDFTRELDEALLDGRIDFAVHSLKDVPTEIPEGLAIVAVPLREDPRDVLVTHSGKGFAELRAAARESERPARGGRRSSWPRGRTSRSSRRAATWTRGCRASPKAGSTRSSSPAPGSRGSDGSAKRPRSFRQSVILPAAGQGALAIVARENDTAIVAILASLDHAASHRAIEAERSLLAALEAGCKAPVAALARVQDGTLRIIAGVFSFDGRRALREEASGRASEAASVGTDGGRQRSSPGARAT